MQTDLFEAQPQKLSREVLADGVVLLRHFACGQDRELLSSIVDIASVAPFRHMKTPGGHEMSAAMTSCGQWGWVTDQTGYRYQSADPQSGVAWPAMPGRFRCLASQAAEEAGFVGFTPDVCLVNRYQPGAKMGLHQDKNEQDYAWPIVSVSLGLPIVFQMGGQKRTDKPRRILLEHGDVLVWGGPARMNYHGVLTLKKGDHPLAGPYRYNLTFRKAG